MTERFDAAYYRRFYGDPDTQVASSESTAQLARFIAAYLVHLDVPVETALDFGCGLGWWRAPLESIFEGLDYRGVEISAHLCEAHGWSRGSIVDYDHGKSVDLVICQGVLQYLNDREARAAIANLARHTKSALYLEALTRGDWSEVCDRSRTDGEVHLRSFDWYRRALRPHFRCAGGGLFLTHDAPVALYELEQAW